MPGRGRRTVGRVWPARAGGGGRQEERERDGDEGAATAGAAARWRAARSVRRAARGIRRGREALLAKEKRWG
jgi:hypothetical protein